MVAVADQPLWWGTSSPLVRTLREVEGAIAGKVQTQFDDQRRKRNIFRGGGQSHFSRFFPGRNFRFGITPSFSYLFPLQFTCSSFSSPFSLFPCLFFRLVSKNFPVKNVRAGGTVAPFPPPPPRLLRQCKRSAGTWRKLGESSFLRGREENNIHVIIAHNNHACNTIAHNINNHACNTIAHNNHACRPIAHNNHACNTIAHNRGPINNHACNTIAHNNHACRPIAHNYHACNTIAHNINNHACNTIAHNRPIAHNNHACNTIAHNINNACLKHNSS